MPDALQMLNNGVPISWYLILSAVLFTLGVNALALSNPTSVATRSTDCPVSARKAFRRAVRARTSR